MEQTNKEGKPREQQTQRSARISNTTRPPLAAPLTLRPGVFRHLHPTCHHIKAAPMAAASTAAITEIDGAEPYRAAPLS